MKNSVIIDGLQSKRLYSSDYLLAEDFSNTTTLYGWHVNGSSDAATISGWVGSKDLTRNGALTQQANHLGDSVYCEFDGVNDYLSSADAAFNFTGTFSAGLWVYRSSWEAVSSAQALMGRYSGTGWGFGLSNNGSVYFVTDGPTYIYSSSYTSLSAGWHYLSFSRTSGGITTFYIDGIFSGSGASSSITAAGNQEIGSVGGGLAKFSGRLSEIIIHNATAWSDSEVARLYARGCRKLSVKNHDGSYQIIGSDKPVYDSVQVSDVTLLDNNSYLTNAECVGASSGTIYGWHINQSTDAATVSNWTGGIDLTRNGNLTQQPDHLGNSVFCEFDGTNDYLSSGDATFSTTGNFSMAIWAYKADWSTFAANYSLATRNDGTNGWNWQMLSGSGNLYAWTANSGAPTELYGPPSTGLSAGWHHFAWVRDSSGSMHFYIDGVRGAMRASAAMTTNAGNTLRVGADSSAGQKWPGRLAEYVYCNGIWSENEVKRIYAKGARHLAYSQTDGSITIPQNAFTFYPRRALWFTSTPAGWSTYYAFGIPYVDQMGQWRLRFNIEGSLTATSNINLNIRGVTFSSAGNQTICGWDISTGTRTTYLAQTQSGSSTIQLLLSNTSTLCHLSGDVVLDSMPII